MFLELIATVFAGIAVAGMVILLNKLTGGRLPRWSSPVAAGLAMIAVTVASEYGWYERTLDGLPEGMEVAQTVENKSFYRPWTYAVPYVERFVAVDRGNLRQNPNVPGQLLADLYFFGRWSPVNRMPVLLDCAQGRRASLADGASFSDSGSVEDARWVSVGTDDPILAAACEEV